MTARFYPSSSTIEDHPGSHYADRIFCAQRVLPRAGNPLELRGVILLCAGGSSFRVLQASVIPDANAFGMR